MIRLCLVDDDFDIASIIKEELELVSNDVRVTRVAHNLDDAKRVIDNFLPLLDCFLLDLSMPQSASDNTVQRDAGLQLLRYLRQTKRFAGTVIMLTNSCEFEDGKKAFDIGCDVYLCKSRELHDLVEAINFCIEHRLNSPELQHFFLPEEITAREARLMEMIYQGATWQQIAYALRYGNAGAARIAAEDIFNKLLSWHAVAPPIDKKREVALQLWKWRHVSRAPQWDEVDHPHRTDIAHEAH